MILYKIMNSKQNAGLLLAVLLTGVINFFVVNSNVSLKGALNQAIHRDDYASPFGPKPSQSWENQWESERAR